MMILLKFVGVVILKINGPKRFKHTKKLRKIFIILIERRLFLSEPAQSKI